MIEHLFKNEIYYRINKFEKNRKNLVFIHGVSGSSSAWKPYEQILENKYNILTYDIRGHGLSKKYKDYEDYEIKNFVNDLNKLLIELNVNKFILISHSFGTKIAIEYIKIYRNKILGIIFLSPMFGLENYFISKITRFFLQFIVNIIKILPVNFKPRGHVDYSKHINSTDWNIKRNFTDMKNTGLQAHFYTLKQSLHTNQKYFLEHINIPTLIIHGSKDTMVPIKNAIEISNKIKNSDLFILPNNDHNIVHNNVKEISIAIENFIERNFHNLL